MSLPGYNDFIAVALSPHVTLKLFRPEDSAARLLPVFELTDLRFASSLPASMEMLGDTPVADAWIVGPGTVEAVERATRGALVGSEDLSVDRLRFIGFDKG